MFTFSGVSQEDSKINKMQRIITAVTDASVKFPPPLNIQSRYLLV